MVIYSTLLLGFVLFWQYSFICSSFSPQVHDIQAKVVTSYKAKGEAVLHSVLPGVEYSHVKAITKHSRNITVMSGFGYDLLTNNIR